jgi:hypothetical protein
MSPKATAVGARVIADVPAFRLGFFPDLSAVEAARHVE